MKTYNGKLLGTTKNDLDSFKEKIEQRCDRLEISLVNEQQQQIVTYKKGLEKVYYLQQVLGKQIEELETKQINYWQKGLPPGSKLKSNKLLWFGFFTFLTVSMSTDLGLIKVPSSNNSCSTKIEPVESLSFTSSKTN